MKGKEIAAMLPPKHGKQREEMILDLVKKGNVVLRWTPIKLFHEGKKYTFYVTAEPLMLGETWEDGFYPGVSAITMQKIADFYNAALLTPKLVDEIWNQAKFRVDPIVGWASLQQAGLPKKATMVDTATMVFHSDLVKKRIAEARKQTGKKAPLISNVGKYWVVNSSTSRKVKSREDKSADAAVNYGWHKAVKGAFARTATLQPNVDIWQTPGTEHPLSHSDYSQLVMLVSRSVKVCEPTGLAGFGASKFYKCKDGGNCKIKGTPGKVKCVDIYDLAQDKTLAKIVSHEGTVNMRIPSVPWEKPESCALLALSGFNPDWTEDDEDDDAMSGLALAGAGPYALLGFNGMSAFGAETCGKPPPSPTSVGEGKPTKDSPMPTGVEKRKDDQLKKYALYGALGVGAAAALYLAFRSSEG